MTAHATLPKVRHSPAYDRLQQALTTALEDADRPPCVGAPQWLSEAPEDRAEAAEACQPCPLLDACAEAAAELRPTFGVWAGLDRSRRGGGADA